MPSPVTLQLNTDNEDIVNLCKCYWEFDDEQGFVHKVSELSREYKIPSNQLTKLVAQYCDALSINDVCSECQKPYVFSSRSDFQQRNKRRWVWKCEECRRKEEKRREGERIEAQKQYRKIIQEAYGSAKRGPINPHQLSFENAIYLMSFIRLCATEDFSFATSLESVEDRFSPTTDMDADIVKQLFQESLIFVHPNSPIDAFEGEKAERFYIFKVLWNLPFGLTSENPKDFANDLEAIFRTKDWPNGWRESRLGLWKKVALNESMQYLDVALGEHGLSLNPGEKTLLVMNNLLEDYSVAQIYNMIWRAAKDAAAFLVRERVTKQHAANTVVGAIQRYGERAKAEKWDIKLYGRHWTCPQSIVSQVLFNVALRIGDDGFNKTPSITDVS